MVRYDASSLLTSFRLDCSRRPTKVDVRAGVPRIRRDYRTVQYAAAAAVLPKSCRTIFSRTPRSKLACARPWAAEGVPPLATSQRVCVTFVASVSRISAGRSRTCPGRTPRHGLALQCGRAAAAVQTCWCSSRTRVWQARWWYCVPCGGTECSMHLGALELLAGWRSFFLACPGP